VRCKLQESYLIVAATRESGLPVTYVVYPDEGHGFLQPESRTSHNAIALCLRLKVRESIRAIAGLRNTAIGHASGPWSALRDRSPPICGF
jgi:acetyl esterase/lipase